MLKGDWQDFDLTIRSMLADAEEPAPSGAWEAISGRLGAAREAVVVPFWKRKAVRYGAVALAFAAALGAAFFFSGTFDKSAGLSGSGRLAQAEKTEAEAAPQMPKPIFEDFVEVPAYDWFATEPAQSGKAASAQVVSVSGQELASQPEATAETVSKLAQEPAEGSSASAAPEQNTNAGETPAQANGKGAGQQARPAGAQQPDPFALMAAEDRLKARSTRNRLAAVLSGGISGNDARNTPPAMGVAPGSAVATTQTSILEKSTSTYGAPVSFGVGLRYNFSPRFSVGTGIDYTLLTRSFTGVYTPGSTLAASVEGDVHHSMQYIGVPLKAYLSLIDSGNIRFYVLGGGAMEFCVSNRYTIPNGESTLVYKERVQQPQFSLSTGLGVEFRLSQRLGLFLDPSVNYYFDCRQPKNVRTEKPFMVNFNAGFRFNL